MTFPPKLVLENGENKLVLGWTVAFCAVRTQSVLLEVENLVFVELITQRIDKMCQLSLDDYYI